MTPRLPSFTTCGIATSQVIFTPNIRGYAMFGETKKDTLILLNNGKLVLGNSIPSIIMEFHTLTHNFKDMGDFLALMRTDEVSPPLPGMTYNFDNLLKLMKRREVRWTWTVESAQYLTDYVWLVHLLLKAMGRVQEKFFRLHDWDKKCDNAMAQLSALLGIARGGDLSGLASFKQWAGAVVQFERAVCDLSEHVSL